MENIIVTVTSASQTFLYDLELPTTVDVGKLKSDIAEALNGYNANLFLDPTCTELFCNRISRQLDNSETLDSAGIWNGDYITLIIKPSSRMIPRNETAQTGILSSPASDSTQSSRAGKATPTPGIIFCTSCGAKNHADSAFCIQCGAMFQKDVLSQESDFEKERTAQYNSTALNNTIVLDPPTPKRPILTRLSTQEGYYVNKPTFRMGSGQGLCDLLVSDNTYISKIHADIVTQNGRYFIVDQNSTNKTYVNGSLIAAGTYVEIFAGTQLRLANEDFTFTIEA